MQWPQETIEAVAEATATAAAKWVNAELGHGQSPGRNDSMMRAVTLNEAHSARAGWIAEAIPRICFKGSSKDNFRGDREIIGQGIASGLKILASDNRSSIRRIQMNGWLMNSGLANEEFVLQADDAIERAGAWNEQPARLLEAVLWATLPRTAASAQREKEIVEAFIEGMRRQGLEGVAASCLEEWNGAGQRVIYDRARRRIETGANLARMTEDRSLRLTRTAARKAGYEGEDASRRETGAQKASQMDHEQREAARRVATAAQSEGRRRGHGPGC